MAMTLRISDDLDQRLTLHAERVGVSKQKFVIRAIEAQLERENQSATASAVFDKVLVRDKELLGKLSSS